MSLWYAGYRRINLSHLSPLVLCVDLRLQCSRQPLTVRLDEGLDELRR